MKVLKESVFRLVLDNGNLVYFNCEDWDKAVEWANLLFRNNRESNVDWLYIDEVYEVDSLLSMVLEDYVGGYSDNVEVCSHGKIIDFCSDDCHECPLIENDTCPYMDNQYRAGKCIYSDNYEQCGYWFPGCPYNKKIGGAND